MRKQLIFATVASLCLIGMTACQQRSEVEAPAPAVTTTETTVVTPPTTEPTTAGPEPTSVIMNEYNSTTTVEPAPEMGMTSSMQAPEAPTPPPAAEAPPAPTPPPAEAAPMAPQAPAAMDTQTAPPAEPAQSPDMNNGTQDMSGVTIQQQ